MTNLTISLDESVIREARVRAIREGTSVSAKVREFLAQYASHTDVHPETAQMAARNPALQPTTPQTLLSAESNPIPGPDAQPTPSHLLSKK